MHITVKQGIDNCYLAHRYEHPGYEEDRCAGLRTCGGEPIDECKECDLYYGNRYEGLGVRGATWGNMRLNMHNLQKL